MTHTRRSLRLRLPLAAAALAASAGLLAVAADRADAFGCSASALRGAVLGQPIAPAVVNPGAGDCTTAAQDLGTPLPLITGVRVASARTATRGAGVTETAAAAGGLADLKIGTAGLNLPLPAVDLSPLSALKITIPASLPGLPPVPGVPSVPGAPAVPGVPGLPGLDGGAGPVPVPTVPDVTQQIPLDIPGLEAGDQITIDARAAAEALLPGGRLAPVDLVEVGAAVANANARCDGGVPSLTGGPQVAALKVLGVEVPTNQVVERTLSLFDTSAIDPSKINVADVQVQGLPAGVTLPTPVLQQLLQPVLDAIPDIAIPATLANVKITPGEQERTAGRLTQRALRVQAGVLGTPIVDLVVGEATVTDAGANCTPPAAPAPVAAEAPALQCTTRRVVLTDVFERDGRVRLTGVADPRRYAGDRVAIALTDGGATVARPVVQPDGSFAATAPLPPQAIRKTNRARYQARIGRDRSLDLKLHRRMLVQRATFADDAVTIVGRVTGPLAAPVRPIVLERRVSCRQGFQRVASVRPRSDGTFRVTAPAPPSGQQGVYRLGTQVRKTTSNPKLFPTFTLPRFVELG